MNADTLEIIEERTFTARINARNVTGLMAHGTLLGLTSYIRADGEYLIVKDSNGRVVDGSASLLALLDLAPKSAVDLKASEIYLGIVDGQHTVLLPGANQGNWDQCMKWSASIGGDLPTRSEQALLYQKFRDQFESTWYWSNTQHASGSDYAWFQNFDSGYQDIDHKSIQGRARAVRRLPI